MQQTVQQIIYFMESEQFGQALDACNKILDSGFIHPQIQTIRAIALSKTNHFVESQNIFNELINKHPKNPELYYNYALILQENKQEQLALKNYECCLSLNQNHLSAINNIGVINLILNQVDDAKFYFEKALKIQPDNIEYIRNLANSCFQLKQYSLCIIQLSRVIQTELAEVSDYILIIDSLYKDNELIKARRFYEQANLKFKDDVELYNLAALIETDSKKYKLALSFANKAVALDSNNIEFQMNQITAESHIQLNQSIIIKRLKKLIKNNPTKPIVFEFSATLCESFSDLKNTKKFLNKGLLVDGNNAHLLLIKAKLLSRKKKYKKSLKCLKRAIAVVRDTKSKIDITYELARTYDKIENHKKAWKNILVANRLNQTLLVHNKIDNKFTNETTQLISDFESHFNTDLTQRADIEEKNSPNLAFIVGFPRSGTTLIERILQAHPTVKVLEETNAINEIYLAIDQLKGQTYFDKLNKLSPLQKQQFHDSYINNLKDYTDWGNGNTIVDKMPMNGTQLALIKTLFPQAKIIFAVRHPIDVCISCLMQNMLQVFSMTSVSKAYATYMKLISVYKEKIKLDMYQIKYENLVEDMPTETKKMLEYLGLEWKDEILNFYQNKSMVNTPSYEQVSQPIYQKSKYRYKNYLKFIKSDIKPLEKWLQYFDYVKVET